MSHIATRRAEAGDFEAVSALLAELGRTAVTDENRERLQTLYERHLERPDTASLVVERGGRVLGFLALERRDCLSRTAPQAWVPDLIVTEDSRGQGAGRALLHAAFVEAKAWGCTTLHVETADRYEEFFSFLMAHGMQETGRVFTIAL